MVHKHSESRSLECITIPKLHKGYYRDKIREITFGVANNRLVQ